MIMDLKLEYQTFRAKPSKSLSQTYTPYKTLFNELTNDGVTLSKHDMNVTFVNSLPEKWLSFSQGLRNAIILRPLTLSISMKVFGKLLEEIHVTWVHLEKKRTRIQLYTEVVSRIAHRAWSRRHSFLATPLDHTRDRVRTLATTSEHNRLKRNLRRFGEATTSENL
nr:retrovirus-related Pol polyprotein from transposon TNT 1-94 [Tanacetum cinerariifolium]